jgi:hypothetical protein
MASLSRETFMIVDRVEAYRIYEVGPLVVYVIWGDLRPLDDLPLSSMLRLKSPARMIRWFWWLRVRFWICVCISLIRCMSCGCVGMYIFNSSIGVMGLLVISMAWRYGDIGLGVGILVMFWFVYMDLDIRVNMPPLAIVGPAYRFCLLVVLLELLYITHSFVIFYLCRMWICVVGFWFLG